MNELKKKEQPKFVTDKPWYFNDGQNEESNISNSLNSAQSLNHHKKWNLFNKKDTKKVEEEEEDWSYLKKAVVDSTNTTSSEYTSRKEHFSDLLEKNSQSLSCDNNQTKIDVGSRDIDFSKRQSRKREDYAKYLSVSDAPDDYTFDPKSRVLRRKLDGTEVHGNSETDKRKNHHAHIWGSWYDMEKQQWGYLCCKSLVKDSECTAT